MAEAIAALHLLGDEDLWRAASRRSRARTTSRRRSSASSTWGCCSSRTEPEEAGEARGAAQGEREPAGPDWHAMGAGEANGTIPRASTRDHWQVEVVRRSELEGRDLRRSLLVGVLRRRSSASRSGEPARSIAGSRGSSAAPAAATRRVDGRPHGMNAAGERNTHDGFAASVYLSLRGRCGRTSHARTRSPSIGISRARAWVAGDDPEEQLASRVARDLLSSPASMWHNEADGFASGALSASERAFFEPRLGVGLRDVRIHNDTRAELLAGTLGARAFTLGNEVYFSRGQYASSTLCGRRLLAHELAHVAQNRASGDGRTIRRDAVVPERMKAGGDPDRAGLVGARDPRALSARHARLRGQATRGPRGLRRTPW